MEQKCLLKRKFKGASLCLLLSPSTAMGVNVLFNTVLPVSIVIGVLHVEQIITLLFLSTWLPSKSRYECYQPEYRDSAHEKMCLAKT